MLSDQQLLRFSRHIMLPEVDIAGQQRWLNARVLIIGLGGLGSPAALYLAVAGIGTLVLVDDDEVELTNLQRQIIHSQARLGMNKATSAALTLAQLNPDTQVICLAQRLSASELQHQTQQADLVLDCTDNFASRFAINRACVATATPLVSGAAIRLSGQIATFQPGQPDSPCYACLYREADDEPEQHCSDTGVLAPLVGIIGAMQALEALKLLANIGQPLTGRLLLLDGANLNWRTLTLAKDPRCPVCAHLIKE